MPAHIAREIRTPEHVSFSKTKQRGVPGAKRVGELRRKGDACRILMRTHLTSFDFEL